MALIALKVGNVGGPNGVQRPRILVAAISHPPLSLTPHTHTPFQLARGGREGGEHIELCAIQRTVGIKPGRITTTLPLSTGATSRSVAKTRRPEHS